MKKNDSGYALPYVLVVMTVLCLVSVSIMSTTLQSLQTQQMTLQRMEDRYAAEGAIEKLIALLNDEAGMANLDGAKAEAAIETKVKTLCTTAGVTLVPLTTPAEGEGAAGGQPVDIGLTMESNNKFTCKMQLESNYGVATIGCILVFTGEYQESSAEKFTITPDKITYDSYTVSYN